ncbi:MAG: toxin [Streptomycetaceae bacterium]|nr:toxin [Streptomycetaceae bacterium]
MIFPRTGEAATSLRRGCQARLTGLELPADCDVVALCAHLGKRRGRPIHCIALRMGASEPSGVWLSLPDAEWVVYEAHTSRVHQEHIITHELAHMICGHRNVTASHTRGMELVFPDLDPSLVRDLMTRQGYSDAQEQEAETMASLLVRSLQRAGASAWCAGVPGALGRVQRSLAPPDL